MDKKSPQGLNVPAIVSVVAVLVIVVGILVRSDKSPSSPPASEPVPALATEPASAPEQSAEASQQITFSSLAAASDNGDNWTLGLAGVPPQAYEDGKKPGVPLSVKADVKGYGRNISIGLIIEGHAGEVYEPGAAKNGRRMPAPTFKVIDESGAVVGSGSFEYG